MIALFLLLLLLLFVRVISAIVVFSYVHMQVRCVRDGDADLFASLLASIPHSRTDIIDVVRQHSRSLHRQQLDGQLPVSAGIPFLRPRVGAGWLQSASSWHQRSQAMNCPVMASAKHVLSLLGP